MILRGMRRRCTRGCLGASLFQEGYKKYSSSAVEEEEEYFLRSFIQSSYLESQVMILKGMLRRRLEGAWASLFREEH
jgi:hypothetical protein